jgi:hypothetical protein
MVEMVGFLPLVNLVNMGRIPHGIAVWYLHKVVGGDQMVVLFRVLVERRVLE